MRQEGHDVSSSSVLGSGGGGCNRQHFWLKGGRKKKKRQKTWCQGEVCEVEVVNTNISGILEKEKEK